MLYAGRLAHEKGIDLLGDAFTAARRRDERLHLVLAGGGPEEERLHERLGSFATFMGWLSQEELAQVYAGADLFLFPSRTDTFGQVVLEAQASGLPVVAVDEGGPRHLVEDRRTGRLCPPTPEALADALVELAARPVERERLGTLGRAAVGARSWERSLRALGGAYARVLAPTDEATRRAA